MVRPLLAKITENMLQRLKFRYKTIPETPELLNSPATVSRINYGRIGLVFTIGVLVFGVFFWQLQNQVALILPVKFQNRGATDSTIALVLTSMPFLLNMIVNPIVSFKSDRTRSRFGRRIPYVMFSVFSASLMCLGLGWSGEIGALLAPVIGLSIDQTVLMLMIIFTIGSMICGLFIGSTIYYLFADLVPQKYFGRFMVMFQMTCAGAGILGNKLLLPLADSYFNWTYTLMSLAYVVAFIIFFLLLREGEYPPVDDENKTGSVLDDVKLFFTECFSIPFYYWFFLMVSFSEVSMVCRTSFNILYARKNLGMSVEAYGDVMMWYMILSLVLSVPVGICIDKFSSLSVYLTGLILVTLVNAFGFYYVTDAASFYVISMLLAVVYTIQNTAALPVYVTILPKPKFGQYSAATALLRSSVMFVGAYGGGQFIEKIGNYQYIFVWDFFLTLLAIPFMLGLIAAWKKLGGKEHYLAPMK